ncbi:MAG: hypothetical protein ACT6R7_06270 [Brevundimonas aurantiaca]|uniref:hypothetical protein n=1 Tax=Brevundimonas aurantiaca TaxID=74316 RepID=UPI0040344F8E
MTFVFAIGAVVLGVPITFQIPLSGQRSPVRAVLPIGMASLLHGIEKALETDYLCLVKSKSVGLV